MLAILQGSDPKLRDQVIVVGAHYDHLGYGGRASLGPYGYIHPGADDNASGTAAVLELAKAFTILSAPPKRSILFAAWDAEEKGLLGSKYWVAHPTVPLEHVVAAVNLDMVGRLRDDHLIVFGARSGYGWRRLLSSQNDDRPAVGFLVEPEAERRSLPLLRARHSGADVPHGPARRVPPAERRGEAHQQRGDDAGDAAAVRHALRDGRAAGGRARLPSGRPP